MQTLVWLALLGAMANAQVGSVPAAPTITLGIKEGTWIRADERFDLRLSEPLSEGAGRLAIMIGNVDWTSLFTVSGATLAFQPVPLRLPQGEQPLVVYLVTPDQRWQEIATFQLRVLARGGYETAEVLPTMEVNNKGQLSESHFPVTNLPPRATFQDFGVNAGLRTKLVKNGWTTTTQINVLGVNHRPQALRYALRQQDAPLVDLASYAVSAQNHVVTLAVGHLSFGAHRLLFNNFSSRGGLASFKFGSRADLAVTGLSGSTIVGWNHILGIDQAKHRIIGGTLGFEIAPRPGAFRVEVSGLDGTLLPQANFNQGKITDAEDSRGLGLRVVAGDGSQRLHLDAGFARSAFVNPPDPLLSRSAAIVPVRDETKDARYLDFSYALIHNKVVAASTPFKLVAAFRHEKVAPLYGSVMSFVRADLFQNVGELTATVGQTVIQGSYTLSHDNVEGEASILETQTRVGRISAVIPLASSSADPTNSWRPSLTYILDRTHQYGARLPINSDFQESHVPDQMNTNHLIGVEWVRSRWRGGYRFNRSFQDNRQVGRALADLANLTNNIAVGITPDPRADLAVELAFEGADNRELTRIDVTRRLGVNGNWRPLPRTTITAIVSTTFTHDKARTNNGRNTDLNLQFAQRFPLSKRTTGKPEAQVFVRYARQSIWTLNQLFAIDDRRRLSTFNTGLTVSLF